MIHIFDDFLSEESVSILQDNLVDSFDITWYNIDERHPLSDLCLKMIYFSQKYFPSDTIVGYENWCRHSTGPMEMHFDKDENLDNEREILKFPICSMVYYSDVENQISGGELNIKNQVLIKPKTNRLVIFGPGLFHGVNKFKGRRVSLLINPWENKPTDY